MNLNIFDFILILILLFGFAAGFKRGIIKQGVITVGTFLVIVLAFIFKNNLSMVLYKHFPFFTIGILEDYSILNIMLYELISFFLLLSIFSLLLAIIIKISGIVEKLVRLTLILALPSKLLGGLLGIIEYYFVLYIVLLIMTMPIFTISNEPMIKESYLKDKILNNTVIVSSLSKDLVNSINDINELLNSKKSLGTKDFNCKALNVFVKNKVVSKKSVKYLKENYKIDSKCSIKN